MAYYWGWKAFCEHGKERRGERREVEGERREREKERMKAETEGGEGRQRVGR